MKQKEVVNKARSLQKSIIRWRKVLTVVGIFYFAFFIVLLGCFFIIFITESAYEREIYRNITAIYLIILILIYHIISPKIFNKTVKLRTQHDNFCAKHSISFPCDTI